MKRFSQVLPLLMTIVAGSSAATADDWPQWLGPKRDSVWRETGILGKFPAGGPRVLWRQAVGGGYAGPAVSDGRVLVTDYLTDGDTTPIADKRSQLDGIERVLCFATADGKLLWKYQYNRPYHVSYPAGPRVTPTVDGDRVYTLGAEGNLNCLNIADGSLVWSRDLPKEYGCETPQWGFAGHPLLDGRKLVCMVGGKGSIAVAFDKATGKEIWRALSAPEPGYSSPAIIDAGGTRQLLIWHTESLNSLDPETGKLYWSEPLKPDWGMSIVTPRSDGKYVFVGAIKMNSMLLRLAEDRPAEELVWLGKKGTGLAPVASTPFLEGGHMYGVDREGELRCVQLSTGEQLWTTYQATTTTGRRTDNAPGFLVKQADRFFIFNETGELVMARLSPNGYEEISRGKILDPVGTSYGRSVVWSHPAFAEPLRVCPQ